eukprot:m51a1_g6978 hypothetical protein (721) ;mRNA; f:119344-122728
MPRWLLHLVPMLALATALPPAAPTCALPAVPRDVHLETASNTVECHDREWRGEWHQLVVGHDAPWALASVCVGLVNAGDVAQTVVGSVVLSLVAVDPTDLSFIPSESRSFPFVVSVPPSSTPAGSNSTSPAIQLQLPTPFVSWTRGAFVGITFSSCGPVGIAYERAERDRPRSLVLEWDGEAWKTSARTGSLALSLAMAPYSARAGEVPPQWTCEAKLYRNGVCDCNCGTWDPDCATSPNTPSCPEEQVCDQSGRCVAPNWNDTACSLNNYWAYDGCQCSCGLYPDPDCFSDNFGVGSCEPAVPGGSAYCNYRKDLSAAPFCEPTWSCDPSRFGDGSVCDCECGAPDPDCDSLRLPTTCPHDHECFLGVCSAVGGSVGFVALVAVLFALFALWKRHTHGADDVEMQSLDRVWGFEQALRPPPGAVESYVLIPAGEEDMRLVAELYSRSPVAGMSIKSVDIAYSPVLERLFEARLAQLQERSGNPAYQPRWIGDKCLSARGAAADALHRLTGPFRSESFQDVSLAPAWHGTSPQILDSILKTGYANLAMTDEGFFGKGIYSTPEARYAWEVYAHGVMLVNWVSFFSAYPVVHGDMEKLAGKGNYLNYDAHFVPVRPLDGAKNQKAFIPCSSPARQALFHELVVFEASQCLPRYVVHLQSSADSPTLSTPLLQCSDLDAKSKIRNRSYWPEPLYPGDNNGNNGNNGAHGTDDKPEEDKTDGF